MYSKFYINFFVTNLKNNKMNFLEKINNKLFINTNPKQITDAEKKK